MIKECVSCGSKNIRLFKNGPHNQLKCVDCDKHNGFIKKENVGLYTKGDTNTQDEMNKVKLNKDISSLKREFKEIHFKLDLIIDHLGIKE